MTLMSTSKLGLGLAAIATAVLGCTAISADPVGVSRAHTVQVAAPVSCTLTTERSRGLLVLVPVVEASHTVSGSYQLRVDGAGTRMNQGGPFAARAGQTLELGRLMLSASAARLDADFTVTVDGRSYACPVHL